MWSVLEDPYNIMCMVYIYKVVYNLYIHRFTLNDALCCKEYIKILRILRVI